MIKQNSYVDKHQAKMKYKASILNEDVTSILQQEQIQQVGVGVPTEKPKNQVNRPTWSQNSQRV